eukprot:1152171-Pelagomonas_calceolata.AAC.13
MTVWCHLKFTESSRCVVADKGIGMDLDEIKAILDWPVSSATPVQYETQMRRFLGLANFHSRWVDTFAGPAAPLNALTTEKADWEKREKNQWVTSSSCRRRMIKEPLFVHILHPTAKYIVETDASQIATGGVIYQCPEPGNK